MTIDTLSGNRYCMLETSDFMDAVMAEMGHESAWYLENMIEEEKKTALEDAKGNKGDNYEESYIALDQEYREVHESIDEACNDLENILGEKRLSRTQLRHLLEKLKTIRLSMYLNM